MAGDVAVIRMGEVLDYSSYMRTMRSMRSDLETRCAEIEELRTSPWTSVALDKGQGREQACARADCLYRPRAPCRRGFLPRELCPRFTIISKAVRVFV